MATCDRCRLLAGRPTRKIERPTFDPSTLAHSFFSINSHRAARQLPSLFQRPENAPDVYSKFGNLS